MKKISILLTCIIILIGCKKSDENTTPTPPSSSKDTPTSPTELKLTLVSTSQIDLTWKDNSNNETGFKIERKVGDGPFQEIATVPANSSTYADKSNIQVKSVYTYRVIAFNDKGNSGNYSNEAQVSVITVPSLQNSKIIQLSKDSCLFSGSVSNNGGADISAIGVIWSTSPNPTVNLSTKTNDGPKSGSGLLSTVLKNLSPNTTYYFRSYAITNAGTVYGEELTLKVLSYDIKTVVGGNGEGLAANQLYRPSDVFVDANNNIYVVDNPPRFRIRKWAPGASNGTLVVNEIFSEYMFMDAIGNIYVASGQSVRKWTPGATTGVTVAGGNGTGSGANQLNTNGEVFVDAQNNIYVCDNGNHRVQKWAPGATTGITVAGGNGAGSNANQLNNPVDITVDQSGNIYVSDKDNHRVQKWAPGATTGTTVAGGNGAGANANQLFRPIGISVDQSGHIYIADSQNYRVQKWAPGATSGITVAGGNSSGSSDYQLTSPQGIFVDPSGHIYIVDRFNHRIQKRSKD